MDRPSAISLGVDVASHLHLVLLESPVQLSDNLRIRVGGNDRRTLLD